MRSAFPGGDRSGVRFGVGGLRWFVGVTGVTGGGSWILSLLGTGLETYVELEGRAECVDEDVRECAGGVGGRSGPATMRLGVRRKLMDDTDA